MTRVQQIAAAMTGRQAAHVNDNSLRDAVRETITRLAVGSRTAIQGAGFTAVVMSAVTAAAKTLIFEGEVPIALEMGAAGELGESTVVNQGNVSRWVAAYAVCGDRRAAQESISLTAARDRARADAVAQDDLRRDYEENGLRRAWDTYCAEGWTFCFERAARLYDRIEKNAIRLVLGADGIARSKEDALASVRHTPYRNYTRRSAEELEAMTVFPQHFKACLVRNYFQALRASGQTPFNHMTNASN